MSTDTQLLAAVETATREPTPFGAKRLMTTVESIQQDTKRGLSDTIGHLNRLIDAATKARLLVEDALHQCG